MTNQGPTRADAAGQPAGRRWLILVAMTGALSMVTLDQTVVSVALPTMAHDLPLTASGQQWVVNAYVLAMAGLVAIGGKLGDRFGQVSTFRAGVILFFLASAACGLTPRGAVGESWMIAARAAQGVGAALMMPISAVIVMAAFAVQERGRAMAIYVGLSQVFLAVGPLLGGILTQQVSWRSVFWLNVPVGIAALILVQVARPDNTRQDGAQVNPFWAALLVAGLGSTVYAIQEANNWSWTSPVTLSLLAGGLGLTLLFVRTQLKTARPLVDVRLFTRPGFSSNAAVVGLSQFALLAIVLFSSIYFQELLGFSPMECGLAALPLILPIALGSQLAGRWYDQTGVRPTVLTGLALAAVGVVAWAASLLTLSYLPQLPGMILTGLGIGLMSPTNTDALGRVGGPDRAQASGLVQAVRQLGGTLGIAVIGGLILSYHGTESGRGHTAAAIAVGFVAAAITVVLALIVGWRTLPRERVTESGDGPMAVAV